MGRGPSLTSAERERIKTMWSNGDSLRTITKTLKRSYDTVHRVLDGPPQSKKQGAPRRLSDQQVQELVQVATTEKLTAKQLKSKFGYECSTRTIQRAVVKCAGQKRRRDEDDSSSPEDENGYTPSDAEETRLDEEQTTDTTDTITEGTVVPVGHDPTAGGGHHAGEATTSSTSSSDQATSSNKSSDSTPLQQDKGGQVADAIVGVPTPLVRASPTQTSDSRHLELADIIQAQNKLLDGVIAQLDRQTSTMEVLLRHLLSQETA